MDLYKEIPHPEETLTIANTTCRVKCGETSPDKLSYWDRNVRFAGVTGVTPNLSQNDLEKKLTALTSMTGLAKSISASGGIHHALEVRSDGVVIEGNKRLAVAKMKNLSLVPIRIFDPDTPAEVFDTLLSHDHLTGKERWGGAELGLWIVEMHEEKGRTLEDIADLAGRSRPNVIRRYEALKVLQKYQAATGDMTSNPYDILHKLLGRKKIVNQLDKDPHYNWQWFFKMLQKGNINGTIIQRFKNIVRLFTHEKYLKLIEEFDLNHANTVMQIDMATETQKDSNQRKSIGTNSSQLLNQQGKSSKAEGDTSETEGDTSETEGDISETEELSDVNTSKQVEDKQSATTDQEVESEQEDEVEDEQMTLVEGCNFVYKYLDRNPKIDESEKDAAKATYAKIGEVLMA